MDLKVAFVNEFIRFPCTRFGIIDVVVIASVISDGLISWTNKFTLISLYFVVEWSLAIAINERI